jgi:hypothetical protein
VDQKEQILSTINQMVDAFQEGDIVGILKTYEPGAVVVAERGRLSRASPRSKRCLPGSSLRGLVSLSSGTKWSKLATWPCISPRGE